MSGRDGGLQRVYNVVDTDNGVDARKVHSRGAPIKWRAQIGFIQVQKYLLFRGRDDSRRQAVQRSVSPVARDLFFRHEDGVNPGLKRPPSC